MTGWIKKPICEAPTDGSDILVRDYGAWEIVRWEAEVDHNGNVDTVTYAPGWVNGTRNNSGGRSTDGRLEVFTPSHFYELPQEDDN